LRISQGRLAALTQVSMRLNLQGSSPARIKLPERAQEFGAPRRASCIRTDPATGRHESSKRGSPPPGQRAPARPHRRQTLKRCPTRAGQQKSRPDPLPAKPRNLGPTGPTRHREFLSPFQQKATSQRWRRLGAEQPIPSRTDQRNELRTIDTTRTGSGRTGHNEANGSKSGLFVSDDLRQ
jgi:hypothetical protein